ncbi:MAG: hypothetical protein K2X50_09740 [Gammaproteobacteria bacterium]|nr:hypothetical protein [Gammaproteobacteria bacterium]
MTYLSPTSPSLSSTPPLSPSSPSQEEIKIEDAAVAEQPTPINEDKLMLEITLLQQRLLDILARQLLISKHSRKSDPILRTTAVSLGHEISRAKQRIEQFTPALPSNSSGSEAPYSDTLLFGQILHDLISKLETNQAILINSLPQLEQQL